MNKFQTMILPMIAVAALAACSSPPTTPVATVANPGGTRAAGTSAPTTAAAAAPTPQSSVATVTLAPHLDPNSPLARARSIYFDFDETSLDNEDVPLVERHGRYLSTRPQLAIRVEGNTDERGSAEYNLALGQKRAEAVVRALKLYGVRDSQLEAVSWGEEKPVSPGHGEADWSQNRRADLRYPGR